MKDRLNLDLGFRGIRIRFNIDYIPYFKEPEVLMEIWQLTYNDDALRFLGVLRISQQYVNGETMFDKVENEFNAKITKQSFLHKSIVNAAIYDKKYEVLDWLESIELMQKLAN